MSRIADEIVARRLLEAQLDAFDKMVDALLRVSPVYTIDDLLDADVACTARPRAEVSL